MISAKEASQKVERLKENIIESYNIEKTENLKIVEQMINDEIKNLNKSVWLPVGMILSSEECTYLIRKGYKTRVCTNASYGTNGTNGIIDVDLQYFVSWGGSQL